MRRLSHVQMTALRYLARLGDVTERAVKLNTGASVATLDALESRGLVEWAARRRDASPSSTYRIYRATPDGKAMVNGGR